MMNGVKFVIVSVEYLDALNGGSGMTRMSLTEVEKWLREHPGFLIRKLTTVQVVRYESA